MAGISFRLFLTGTIPNDHTPSWGRAVASCPFPHNTRLLIHIFLGFTSNLLRSTLDKIFISSFVSDEMVIDGVCTRFELKKDSVAISIRKYNILALTDELIQIARCALSNVINKDSDINDRTKTETV